MNLSRQLLNVKVAMRDGVRLSSDIYFPKEEKDSYPVVFVRTPYNKVIPWNPDQKHGSCEFTENGYIFIIQDTRGRHDSDGTAVPFEETSDGIDTIYWILAQPWCNGKVGMVGGSYCGFVQIYAALESEGQLAVIVPHVFGSDMFKNVFYKNGVLQMSLLVWALHHSGRTGRSFPVPDMLSVLSTLPLKRIDYEAGLDVPFFREWLSHPVYDDYWKTKSLEENIGKLEVPALIAGGWYDIFSDSPLRLFSCFAEKNGLEKASRMMKIIIGPWGHAISSARVLGDIDFGDSSLVGFPDLQRKWIGRFLKGEAEAGNEPPIDIFVMGRNEWRSEYEWPLKRTTYKDLYISSLNSANSSSGDGILTADFTSGTESDSYIYDPMNPIPAIGGQVLGNLNTTPGPFDQQDAEKRDDMLVFTSESIEGEIEVTGSVRIELFVSSSAVDTDFIARLCDVYPDGRSINLCDGIIRTRFRYGIDREVMMEPGERVKLVFHLDATSNVFMHGHKIRLEVCSSCFPRFARNLNTGGNNGEEYSPVVARQTIYHSKDYPSKIVLPLIP